MPDITNIMWLKKILLRKKSLNICITYYTHFRQLNIWSL